MPSTLELDRPANSQSFRARLKQLPHPKSGFRVRKMSHFHPISYMLLLIEQNFGKNAPFSTLTQLPKLRLAGLTLDDHLGCLASYCSVPVVVGHSFNLSSYPNSFQQRLEKNHRQGLRGWHGLLGTFHMFIC